MAPLSEPIVAEVEGVYIIVGRTGQTVPTAAQLLERYGVRVAATVMPLSESPIRLATDSEKLDAQIAAQRAETGELAALKARMTELETGQGPAAAKK